MSDSIQAGKTFEIEIPSSKVSVILGRFNHVAVGEGLATSLSGKRLPSGRFLLTVEVVRMGTHAVTQGSKKELQMLPQANWHDIIREIEAMGGEA